MEKTVVITDNEKWEAVVSCNQKYNGLFFYAVKTTGIFCHPSCRAKTPLRDNVLFFEGVHAAIAAGFRPCKKCRPDEAAFEPNLELTRKAKKIFDQTFDKRIGMKVISKQLGVSTNHLAKLYKEHFGLTPNQYIAKLKIGRALKLLAETDLDILQIAYSTGFKSLSYFYKCCKEQTGCSPKEYRKVGGNL